MIPLKSQGISNGEEGGRIVSVRMMQSSTGCALKMDKEPQAKECLQPLEFGKSIYLDSPPGPTDRNMALLTP